MSDFYKRKMEGGKDEKTPPEPRLRPQLKTYMRTNSVPQPDSEPENQNTWTFFEHPKDSFMMDFDLVARMAWNPYHRCYFYYVGKRNKAGTVTTVKFSQYEGIIVRDFLSKILDEISLHPKIGRKFTDLIPFFDTDPSRATVSLQQDMRAQFWTDPDLQLETIRLRVVFNRIKGEYEFIFNNKVSDVVSKRLKNWQGPQLTFSMAAVRNFEAFLTEISQPAAPESQ
ncbi:unnamed protein product [Allacma fusca]|uniref:Uncharacterized protein n=1 Tax=Allacma fusca TaxID=39272 RepID=A0A8J2KGT5_9HEXA|nr:unnamed protein product [Allacma fusca]